MERQRLSCALFLLLVAVAGCGGEDKGDKEPDCTGDTCDVGERGVVTGTESAACKKITTEVGNVPLDSLNDQVADLIFRSGDDCPQTLSQILKKIHREQKGCGDYQSATNSMVVSEEAQNTGEPGTYRVVTTRFCDDSAGDLFLSTFSGPGATVADVDQGTVELIAVDKTTGLFNYYDVQSGGNFNFVDNSDHMRNGGRCGECHTQGGLVMKELHSPWIYWEEILSTPGATAMFETTNDKEVGGSIYGIQDEVGGATLENFVHSRNRTYVKNTVATLKKELESTGSAETMKKLLEPVFCTKQINLDSLDFADESGPMFVNNDWFVDSRFYCADDEDGFCFDFGRVGEVDGVSLDFADYHRLMGSFDHEVADAGKTDTALPFIYAERSDIDALWTEELVKQGVIDHNTSMAILSVDGTRPVFSKERCDLAALSPKIDPSGSDPLVDRVWTGLVNNVHALEDVSTPGTVAADFARSLMLNAEQNVRRAERFLLACRGRNPSELTESVMMINSARRLHARERHVIEAKDMIFPSDTFDVSQEARLSRSTCEVVDTFKESVADCTNDAGQTGTCIDTKVTSCSSTAGGLCPGPDRVTCCLD